MSKNYPRKEKWRFESLLNFVDYKKLQKVTHYTNMNEYINCTEIA